jgi:hypothetical protein
MDYIVKVLTSEFKAKVDVIVEAELDKHIEDNDIDPSRISFIRSFKKGEKMSFLYLMWNGQVDFTQYPILKTYYNELGILEPEYTEITLKAQQQGYQSRPRVEWNGEIKKIDDIDDIFSFERAE